MLAHARSEAQQGAEEAEGSRAESGRGMISTRGTGKVCMYNTAIMCLHFFFFVFKGRFSYLEGSRAFCKKRKLFLLGKDKRTKCCFVFCLLVHNLFFVNCKLLACESRYAMAVARMYSPPPPARPLCVILFVGVGT